jgi:hypothetical protein
MAAELRLSEAIAKCYLANSDEERWGLAGEPSKREAPRTALVQHRIVC